MHCIVRLLSLFLVGTSSLLAIGQEPANRNRPRNKSPKGPSIQWVNQLKPGRELPARTRHLTFHSQKVDQKIGYCVYLPPSYDERPEDRFPVIYNLHGNGGNEFTSLDSIEVLHEGILAGRWPEMIMVLPNGGHSTFYKDSADGRFPIESIFMQELIPHIDRSYRTIASGAGRCIEGFSMGGRGSTRLAVKYPEEFCSLFCQAGNVPHLLDTFDATPESDRGSLLLGADRKNWEANDVYHLCEANRQRIQQHLRIQIACGTRDAGHLSTIRDFHEHLKELKIDHTYIELESLAHRRTEMISRLRPIWFDYHVESLRIAGKRKSEQ